MLVSINAKTALKFTIIVLLVLVIETKILLSALVQKDIMMMDPVLIV